jgi:hypothetical protein
LFLEQVRFLHGRPNIWLVMVGEALHGHPLPMFPWDPPGLSTR